MAKMLQTIICNYLARRGVGSCSNICCAGTTSFTGALRLYSALAITFWHIFTRSVAVEPRRFVWFCPSASPVLNEVAFSHFLYFCLPGQEVLPSWESLVFDFQLNVVRAVKMPDKFRGVEQVLNKCVCARACNNRCQIKVINCTVNISASLLALTTGDARRMFILIPVDWCLFVFPELVFVQTVSVA